MKKRELQNECNQVKAEPSKKANMKHVLKTYKTTTTTIMMNVNVQFNFSLFIGRKGKGKGKERKRLGQKLKGRENKNGR